MKTPTKLNDVMKECGEFPDLFQSLYLATCNAAAEPEASYAPYVKLDGSYYIYVSELSAHTANLAATKRCSVLFIESETEAKNIFGRRRLTLQCDAIECSRESAKFELMMDKFVEKFGDFINMIRKLNDFHLYQLHPQRGAYVAGFAQAYTLTGEGLSEIKHRNE
jgi:putative heme iron utilization protein